MLLACIVATSCKSNTSRPLDRLGGGTRDSNPPGIRNDRIELAEHLGREIQGGSGVAGGLDQRARDGVLRSASFHGVYQNIGIEHSRLNRHRRRCSGGEGCRAARDARRVVLALRRWRCSLADRRASFNSRSRKASVERPCSWAFAARRASVFGEMSRLIGSCSYSQRIA